MAAATTRTPRARRSGSARQRSSRSGSSAAPLPAGGLLGREAELAELGALLANERLVTLTGAPGIGKTRLALKLAETVANGSSRGAQVVELAPIARPGHVPRAVASALSLQEQPGHALTDTIIASLRPRRTVLVLDNCEHLVGACAKLVDRLLAGCPELEILATSREPLGLPAERVWMVPPLALPDQEEALPGLMDSPAVRLFVERAAAVQPGFSLSAYVARSVAEICLRLDGIPLAIELAAAQVASLTPQEIAERLHDRFSWLRRANGAEPARHQTLQAALDWSYELLSDAERALLRRLSVFVGGWELEAAGMVCAGADLEPGQVPALLGGLVAKSLVVSDTRTSAARYRLLETIRAYAGERLEEAGERAEARSAHARFYLALAEAAEPELTGPKQQAWFERLEAERANLRSAIEWSLSHGEPEAALRLAGALVLFWRVRCHFREGRELLSAAVAAGTDETVRSCAKGLWGLGFMTLMVGDPEGAVPALKESLHLARKVDDVQGQARALLILGNASQYQDQNTAVALLEQSAALAREAGDAWCLGHALGVTGIGYASADQASAARPLLEECLGVAREAGDKQGLRFGLVSLGLLAVGQGDYHSAQPVLEEALAIADELGEDYSKAWARQLLAQVAIGRGEYIRARELLDSALAEMREAAVPLDLVSTLSARARVARVEGDRGRARRLLEEALSVAPAGSATRTPALQGMGELAAEEGDDRSARRFFEEALDLSRAHGERRDAARALHGIGHLARAAGETKQAAVAHNEALTLQQQVGNAPGVASELEAIAGLAAGAGHCDRAARLFGAATCLRDRNGYARPASEVARYQADLALVRKSLSTQQFDVAFAEGAALSTEDAFEQASKAQSLRACPATGWSSLTESERRVADLASQGLRNREIAEVLFLSPGTVKYYLSQVFSKLGISGRIELARDMGDRRRPAAR